MSKYTNIKSRIGMYLAKIAGRDVDTDTLMPPVPINEQEELLSEIADRIDNIKDATLPEVGTTDAGKVLTVGEDGAWAPAESGGGGGLPPATTLDYGKVLTLQKAPATMATIVPEQTVTVVNQGESVELENIDTSLVAEGVECRLSIDGGETYYTGTIDSDWYLEVGNPTITVDFNNSTIGGLPHGDYLVSVITPSAYKAEPAWLANGGGVMLLHLDNSTHRLDKTFSEIAEAQASGALVYYIDTTNDETGIFQHPTYLLAYAGAYDIEDTHELQFRNMALSNEYVDFSATAPDAYPEMEMT